MIFTCESCGRESKRKRGCRGRFCSRECWGAEMSRNNPQKYSGPSDFWAKIKIEGKGSCWKWTGSTNRQGYGQLSYRRTSWLAHRLAFFLITGKQPECVCHHCDNPICCNPSHLFGGDRGANNADRHAKGRSRGGRNIGSANGMFGKRRRSENANARAAERIR